MELENVVVGAGLSGAVIAERIATELNEHVLVIDQRDHIAGNCYDYKDENGILIQKYGPHIFHTNDKKVWDYLSTFTKWHYFILQSKVFLDGQLATLPLNLNTLYEVFPLSLASTLERKLLALFPFGKRVPILDLLLEEDADIRFFASFFYDNVFKNYTYKQWGAYPDEIDPQITGRVPFVVSKNNGYFNDIYQGIPLAGYTAMVKNMLEHENISVKTSTFFNDIKGLPYKRLFFTGSIDDFFSYQYGILPYRSLFFDIQEKDTEYYQNVITVRYPNHYDFTRIFEHKYLFNTVSKKTAISVEYPSEFVLGKNERYYPINSERNNKLYEKYASLCNQFENVYFLGRLGGYRYLNMDIVIRNALDLAGKVIMEKKV